MVIRRARLESLLFIKRGHTQVGGRWTRWRVLHPSGVIAATGVAGRKAIAIYRVIPSGYSRK
jgi:hypothetical protein